jgi:hypothetical protein
MSTMDAQNIDSRPEAYQIWNFNDTFNSLVDWSNKFPQASCKQGWNLDSPIWTKVQTTKQVMEILWSFRLVCLRRLWPAFEQEMNIFRRTRLSLESILELSHLRKAINDIHHKLRTGIHLLQDNTPGHKSQNTLAKAANRWLAILPHALSFPNLVHSVFSSVFSSFVSKSTKILTAWSPFQKWWWYICNSCCWSKTKDTKCILVLGRYWNY